MKKPGLTKEQHSALGLELAKIQDQINAAIETVGAAYLSNGREVKKLEQAGKAISLARAMMEERADSEMPRGPKSPPDSEFFRMYYPDGHSTGWTRWSA